MLHAPTVDEPADYRSLFRLDQPEASGHDRIAQRNPADLRLEDIGIELILSSELCQYGSVLYVEDRGDEDRNNADARCCASDIVHLDPPCVEHSASSRTNSARQQPWQQARQQPWQGARRLLCRLLCRFSSLLSLYVSCGQTHSNSLIAKVSQTINITHFYSQNSRNSRVSLLLSKRAKKGIYN